MTKCLTCGAEIDQPAKGRKKMYCNQNCKQIAWQKKKPKMQIWNDAYKEGLLYRFENGKFVEAVQIENLDAIERLMGEIQLLELKNQQLVKKFEWMFTKNTPPIISEEVLGFKLDPNTFTTHPQEQLVPTWDHKDVDAMCEIMQPGNDYFAPPPKPVIKSMVVSMNEMNTELEQHRIKGFIEDIKKETCPTDRNTLLGKKSWNLEQKKRITELENQLKPTKL